MTWVYGNVDQSRIDAFMIFHIPVFVYLFSNACHFSYSRFCYEKKNPLNKITKKIAGVNRLTDIVAWQGTLKPQPTKENPYRIQATDSGITTITTECLLMHTMIVYYENKIFY